MLTKKDDPKFRALLMRREQGHTVPLRLWAEEKAPPEGIIQIITMHNRGQITGKEFFRYLYEWMLNIAEHTGTKEDIERLQKVSRLTQATKTGLM